MKKIFLLLFFLTASCFARATTSITVHGFPNKIMQCDVPFGGGDCIQYYYNDEGILYISVNGQLFGASFSAEPVSTATYVAQDLADQISNYFGVSATVTQLDGMDPQWSQAVSIEIGGNYTLSDAYRRETSASWPCDSCSAWSISY